MLVTIRHVAEESRLAGAWRDLLRRISHGAVKVSCDGESAYLLAILTPRSLENPWILWECAGARGQVVPLVFGCTPAGPLGALPATQADDRDDVLALCRQMLRAAGLDEPATRDWEPALDAYFDAIRLPLHSLKVLRRIIPGRTWHVDDALRAGRPDELSALANLEAELPPAAAFALHSRLSQVLLDRGEHAAALEAVDRALAIAPGDPCLLLRKGTVLLAQGRSAEVKRVVTQLNRLDPATRTDPEVAALEVRSNRQLYAETGERSHLVAAVKAARRAYEKHPEDCFAGADYATLSLINGDTRTAVRVARGLVDLCQELQEQGVAVFRVDFALAEGYLVLGDFERARQEYVRGLVREVRPGARELAGYLKRLRELLPEHDLPDLEVLLK
ncbi:MAG TPA: tetratricopeptide repeat protein [Symbiobacteriaceae bacterium]|nr:tetratricopeptide repeat protein [Symbiobacteriaceae bacterium]